MRLSPLLLLCLTIAVPMLGASAQAPALKPEEAAETKAVLELFTSQGCSSCPPADELFREYAARKDLVALTYHVDYWDYLGWKDTLASPRFTERQRAYAKTHGDGMVYTPQMVVTGTAYLKGSNRAEIDKAIEKTSRAFAANQVPVRIVAEKGALSVDVGAGPAGEVRDATVWLALVQRQVEVAIRHGENSGRKLTYENVVRELTPVGTWNGKATTLRLDAKVAARIEADRCAVIVQQGAGGRILGVAWHVLK